jgi:hypothetical protein
MAGTQVLPTSPYGTGGGGGGGGGGWTDGGTTVYLDTTTDVVSIGSNTPVTNRKLSIINTGTNLGIAVTPLASTDNLLESKLAAEANARFTIDSGGVTKWGAGGASAPDLTVQRSATNTLQFTGATAASTLWEFFGTQKTSSRRRAVTNLSAATLNISTAASAYDVVFCDPTAAAQTITLPSPAGSGNGGRTYTIKRTTLSANTVTIQSAAGNIDGAATLVLAGGTRDSVDLANDGANWWVI